MLLSDNERIDYIRSVIHVDSEVRFIHLLEEYVKPKENLFRSYDWWLFSRVDEKLDDINIPYYMQVKIELRISIPDYFLAG